VLRCVCERRLRARAACAVSLQELYLSHNAITAIEGVEALTQLSTIDLSANRITRVEGLDTNVLLEDVWVGVATAALLLLLLFLRLWRCVYALRLSARDASCDGVCVCLIAAGVQRRRVLRSTRAAAAVAVPLNAVRGAQPHRVGLRVPHAAAAGAHGAHTT
jgi:hypothetical protein